MGGAVGIGRGAGCAGVAEDTTSAKRLLAVQRKRLLEVGVEAGPTGDRERRLIRGPAEGWTVRLTVRRRSQ